MSSDLEVVYVTVGTTKFDNLIEEITSDITLRILKFRGCRKLIIQTGNGLPVDAEQINSKYGINVEQYKFKFEPTREDIHRASLVIGHAGAGTCMDILHAGKPGLIVVNSGLMDNHQQELALQLTEEGYIYYCEVSQLSDRLKSLDFSLLHSYSSETTANNMSKFINCMNELTDTSKKNS